MKISDIEIDLTDIMDPEKRVNVVNEIASHFAQSMPTEEAAKIRDRLLEMFGGEDDIKVSFLRKMKKYLEKAQRNLSEMSEDLARVAYLYREDPISVFKVGQFSGSLTDVAGILNVVQDSMKHFLDECECQKKEESSEAQTEPPPPEAVPEQPPEPVAAAAV